MQPININSLIQGDKFPSTTTLMSLIFMTLKLCGQISWNWVLVFLPMILSVVVWGALAVWNVWYYSKQAQQMEQMAQSDPNLTKKLADLEKK